MTYDGAFDRLYFNDGVVRHDGMRRFPEDRQRNQDPRLIHRSSPRIGVVSPPISSFASAPPPVGTALLQKLSGSLTQHQLRPKSLQRALGTWLLLQLQPQRHLPAKDAGNPRDRFLVKYPIMGATSRTTATAPRSVSPFLPLGLHL